MNRMWRLSLFFLFSSCGPLPAADTASSTADPLVRELERVSAGLLWCDDLPSKNRPHALTGRPDCDTGDSMFAAAVNLYASDDMRLRRGILDSIGADGRPYRSPEHRRVYEAGFDDGKAFSRDHTLGLLFYFLATRDAATLDRVWGWAARHGLRICVGTPAQCRLTPAVLDLVGDVFERLGRSRPAVTRVPGFLLEAEALQEARENTGYRLALVADKILLKAILGKTTSSYRETARIVAGREPENLYYRFVATFASGGSGEVYRDLEGRLVERMRQWPTARLQAWAWSAGEYEKAMGWDYVFLGRMLLRARSDSLLEDGGRQE